MAKKFHLPKIFNRLGVSTIPFVSIVLFLPIFLTYGLSSNSPTETSQESPSVRSLKRISSSELEESLVSKDSAISASTTPQKQKPQQPTQKTPPQAPIKSSQPSTKQQPAKKTQNPSSSATPSYKPPKLEIKVALLRDAENAVVGTSTQASIEDRNGRVLKTIAANQGITVYPNGSNLTLGNSQLPYAVWVKPKAGGFVYVGDRWYRGKLLLVSQGNTLLAVNHVNLEEYLYSVVGSEMHATAPLEALKAQAIAARSYALVHMIRPASEWYHLGNTERWQVYKGLASEYDTTHKAVNATAGQILSYNGGIVESLYASTDEIVSNVHRGIGMSQTGAYDLAAQGYDHQWILGRYYPGVGLSRLILQQ
ncbi:sporulation protein SpoIID [Hydrococcus rivularis NIES-593]|uniref:Sporulation protein SpoIID n=1 Tax=Hydrococcus rivularis NIES-593 TaxID=1921803 RepID=A0A1U7HT39_9CYAN|nr:SpoIID/LytB domain-containing protein [Hydrococcus rivularis]OKH26708.1 sporulation protein SpoIID [Hydrococcus rivularis NIES-593]